MAEELSDYFRKRGNYSTILHYEFSAENRWWGGVARKLYFSLRSFEPMYWTLFYAAHNSSLILTRRDELVLNVKSQSLGVHVSKTVLNHLKATATGLVLQIPLKGFATIIGFGLDLVDLKNRIKNRSTATGSREKRFREKLKLVALLVGKTKVPLNPYAWQVIALRNYDLYEVAREEYRKCIIKDLLFKGVQIDNTPKLRRG